MAPESSGSKGRIIDEAFVRKRAERITESDIEKVSERSADIEKRLEKPGPIRKFGSDLRLLLSMVKAYANRSYREVPYWAIGSATFALLYVLNPMDMVPDFLPIVGQLDDAAVVGMCLSLVKRETKRYEKWQDEQGEDKP